MNWALIVMTCVRVCTVQHAELYDTKAECTAAKPQDSSIWTTPMFKYVCVPTVKGEKK